jgi:hypothetical protein
MPPEFWTPGGEIGLARRLDKDYPVRALTVIPIGGQLDAPPGMTGDIAPDYQKFNRALKTNVRPVLLSLQRLPFRDLKTEEFLGRTGVTGRGGKAVSVFNGSNLTLGQMADACIFYGRASYETLEP